MAEKERKGIAVAGSLMADTFYKIDTYPREGRLAHIWETENHIGGSGNLILDLAKLDPNLRVEVSALIGKDDRGEYLVKKLKQYPNIQTDNLKRDGVTSLTLVMNAQDTKQRTFFFMPVSSDQFDLSCIDWDKLNASIFHLEYLLGLKKVDDFDPVYGTHGAKILYEARKRGMATSIDMISEESGRAAEIVACSLKYTDYCAINEVEAEAVTGIDLTSSAEMLEKNGEAAVRKLKELGVSKWAVIHSPKYSYGYDCEKDLFLSMPSLRLPDGYIKGTNGAGDAFCSGILYAAHEGRDIEFAMKLAGACAACSLSEENGTDGMRPFDEVMKVAGKYK